MLRLSTEPLGRLLRVDEPIEELGISSYDRLRDAIESGDRETALQLVDYIQDEGGVSHDVYCDWVHALLTWVADNCGEEKLPEVLAYCREKISITLSAQLKNVKTVKQLVQFYAEQMRAHRSGPGEKGEFTLWEDQEKYVMIFDPCGAGGRMRRTSREGKLPPRTEPPYSLGKTKKEYAWSWHMKGIPYLCLHCSVWHEWMAIKATGAPSKVTEYDSDPNAPCKFYFYKKPDLVPEKYYKRVGLEKPRPVSQSEDRSKDRTAGRYRRRQDEVPAGNAVVKE